MNDDYGLTQHDDFSDKLLAMSVDDFVKYEFVNRKTNITCTLQEFKYVDINCHREKSMMLKNRVEWDGDNVNFEKIVFSNSEKILLHNYSNTNITFISCVFFAPIQFIEKPNSISFDSCVIRNTYATNIDELESITMISCLINHLFLRCTKANTISIYRCRINKLSIMEIDVNEGFFLNNSIRQLYYIDSEIKKLEFDYKQLIFISKAYSPSIKLIKKTIGKVNKTNPESLISTLDFIQALPVISKNSVICSRIDYIKATSLNHDLASSILLKLYGNFILPSRTLITSIFIILLFAMAYYLNENGFKIIQINGLYKYLEYSIEAFLGSPKEITCNMYKLYSYIERFIGFFSMTAFTISLAKKYLR